jgi:branched-chain amino acid transport system ATP-binding protein
MLEVRSLSASYGQTRVLDGVDLTVGDGEFLVVIGPNGHGKTTLLRTISGLIRPQVGSLKWFGNGSDNGRGNGTELQSLAAHEIVHMGICHVPEGRQVFANLTVRENLLLGGYQQRRSVIQQDLVRVYDSFPVLAERREQKAGTLSGGEQQMLAIGRALMAHPQLLLLDEPSLGLAPLVVRKIFQIIREINAQGTTVFLVEQNAHMALTTAHRGYVLQTGEVVKADSAKKLLEDPDVKKAYLGG